MKQVFTIYFFQSSFIMSILLSGKVKFLQERSSIMLLKNSAGLHAKTHKNVFIQTSKRLSGEYTKEAIYFVRKPFPKF